MRGWAVKGRYSKSKRKPTGFFILNGVRRALVTREAGRKTIAAVVYQEGHKPVIYRRLSLRRLRSPKATVYRDERFIAIQIPIYEPIEVEPLHVRGQQPSVPLSRVRIV